MGLSRSPVARDEGPGGCPTGSGVATVPRTGWRWLVSPDCGQCRWFQGPSTHHHGDSLLRENNHVYCLFYVLD